MRPWSRRRSNELEATNHHSRRRAHEFGYLKLWAATIIWISVYASSEPYSNADAHTSPNAFANPNAYTNCNAPPSATLTPTPTNPGMALKVNMYGSEEDKPKGYRGILADDWLPNGTQLPRYQLYLTYSTSPFKTCSYMENHTVVYVRQIVKATITDLKTGDVFPSKTFAAKKEEFDCPSSRWFSSLKEEELASSVDEADIAAWLKTKMASHGFAFSTSTPTLVLTATQTPTRTPTLTPTPTATPSCIAITEGNGIPVWKGIPIMPGAWMGTEFPGVCSFFVNRSSTEITTYYREELAKRGWDLRPDPANLVFDKGATSVVISVGPPINQTNQVTIYFSP